MGLFRWLIQRTAIASIPKCMFASSRSLRLVLRMNEERFRFLSLPNPLPGRLTAEETSWLLNCQPHDIPALISARLLKPLGNPPPRAVKFFFTADVLDSRKDRSWLTKMTNTIYQHWHRQNSRRNGVFVNGSQNGHSSLAEMASASC